MKVFLLEATLTGSMLHFTGIIIIILSVLIIALHTAILALGAQRSNLKPSTKFIIPVVAAALLASWFAWAALAVNEPVVVPPPPIIAQRSVLLIVVATIMMTGIAILFISKTVQTIYNAVPSEWLIGVQTYRIGGVMFLYPYLATGALPPHFALPAGVGDMLIGIAAPFVAIAVAQKRS